MQQSVRVERVPHAAAALHVVGEPDRRGTFAKHLAVGVRLRLADAVLVHDVIDGVLAFERHVGTQLERLQVDFGFDAAVQFRQRLLQARKPDRAPGTGDVGNEIDAERSRGGHGDLGSGMRPIWRRRRENRGRTARMIRRRLLE